ncbi:MAG TPA: cytochrome c [Candidatus Acidoferrales bacterium]|nr:cytochrome c [Candidatus Acidoferrales bacterium]
MQPSRSRRNLRPLGMVVLFVALGIGVLSAVNAARNWSATAKARKLRNPIASAGQALAAGRILYGDHCQKCHGEKGDGKGQKAPELSVAPGDFTDSRKMSRVTDGELFWQITKGRLPMPAFANKMSDEQRWQLVDYIRTFGRQAAGSSPASTVPKAAPPPP